GRIGWLVVPRLLTYFSGGHTEGTFDRQKFFSLFIPIGAPIPGAPYLDKRTYNGWFLGAGDEYAVSFLPGLFWKTEYRVSEYNRTDNVVRFFATGLPTGDVIASKNWDQTIRSEMVYRFNWGG